MGRDCWVNLGYNTGAFRDENQPQVKAIREALVNLLIHSDYFSPMKPRIRVFTDRIEFFNPGALPKPYEELQKRDISLPRNPLITKMFRVIDLAENAGYGFDKMIKGWKSHYEVSPIISGDIDNYRIEFFFDGKLAENRGIGLTANKINSQLENELSGLLKDLDIKWSDRWSELTKREQQLLILIINEPKISRLKISEKLGINPSAKQKHITKLKDKGIIKRIGSDKGGHWEVLK